MTPGKGESRDCFGIFVGGMGYAHLDFRRLSTMKSNKKLLGLLAGVAVCISMSAFATSGRNVTEPAVCEPPQINWSHYEWILMRGGNQAVCQEMLHYLRSLPKHEPPPVCLKDRLPPNIHWTLPDWKILSQEKKEALLARATGASPALVSQLREAEEWKVVRTDITQDDEPETLLAFGEVSPDCRRATRCAAPDGPMKGMISLTNTGGNTALLPMTDDGEHIRFTQTRSKPLTRFGELVFYKEKPYWISPLRWEQKFHDDFLNHRAEANPKNKYNRMFQMGPMKARMASNKRRQGMGFQGVSAMFPNPAAACYFGYFHRDNLK